VIGDDLGVHRCEWCEEDAGLCLNGEWLCAEHFNVVLGAYPDRVQLMMTTLIGEVLDGRE